MTSAYYLPDDILGLKGAKAIAEYRAKNADHEVTRKKWDDVATVLGERIARLEGKA